MSRTDIAVLRRSSVDLPRPGLTLAAVVVAGLALALLWTGVATGTLLAALDPAADAWIVAVRSAGLVVTARVASDVAQPAVMIGLLVVVTVILAARTRSWVPVAISAGALTLLGAFDNGVKVIVARPRPPKVWHAVTAHGPSFPSGHALWSAGVLLLVVVLVGGRHRPMIAVIAILVAVIVAGSRLVLAVHYPSDVLAGWSLAVLADGIVLLVAARVAHHPTPRFGTYKA